MKTGTRKRPSYFARFWRTLTSLLSGMGLTFRYFSNPKNVVTQQYPENRPTLQMFERYRGKVVMPHDEDSNTHKCTACTICESACPNGTIKVITTKHPETGKRILDKYIYRFETCILCNHCIEACPFDAIAMSVEFENAVFDRRELVQTLNRPGSKLAEKEDHSTEDK